jgi:hypothetical protein
VLGQRDVRPDRVRDAVDGERSQQSRWRGDGRVVLLECGEESFDEVDAFRAREEALEPSRDRIGQLRGEAVRLVGVVERGDLDAGGWDRGQERVDASVDDRVVPPRFQLPVPHGLDASGSRPLDPTTVPSRRSVWPANATCHAGPF